MEKNPLLTTDELARYLNLEVNTIRRLVKRGILAAYRIGNEYRFKEADIEAFLEENYLAVTKAHFGIYLREVQAEEGLDYSRRIDHAFEIATKEAQAHALPLDFAHFFFGLSQAKGSITETVLKNVGLTEENLRTAILSLPASLKTSDENKVAIFNAILKKAELEGAKYIGTEHALLALLDDEESSVSEALKFLNILPQSIKEELLEIQRTAEA